jgi:thioesterase domain-containing protein
MVSLAVISTIPNSPLNSSSQIPSPAFHGRIDQQIKLRGFRIEPAEIEAQLLSHPALVQAAVVLRRDDPANPRLIAYWVPHSDQLNPSPSPAQLRAFLAQRLPDYMVPATCVQLDALPLTANGKLDRRALPAPAFSADPAQRVAPTSPLEHQLHAIWADILGHSDFGIHDNFFAVGGHSLAAARLASAMQHIHGDSTALTSIFRHPTIAELSRLQTKRTGEPGDCIITLQPHGNQTPLFAVHGMGGTVWGFIELARHLRADRPVFGIQAVHQKRIRRSNDAVREMAGTYAEAILENYKGQPIHLVGYSAGGWYAHAVAEAVMSRGGSVASLIILDTRPNAKIHRRIGAPLMMLRLLERLPIHLRWLIKPSTNKPHSAYVLERLRSAAMLTQKALGWQPKSKQSSPGPIPDHAERHAANNNTHSNTANSDRPDFVNLLATSYRPSRLPISAYVLTPETERRQLELIWGFYCRDGVETQVIFNNHKDFLNPGLMPELAQALENTMQSAERRAMASSR